MLTLGAKRELIAHAGGTQVIPGFKVKAVDTTASGYVFNGALAVVLTEGMAISDGVRFANTAGAISVTFLGAQRSAPTRRAIERFLNSRGIRPSGLR